MTDIISSAALHVLQRTRPECRQWPALIGPTGAGKTARANELARELGLPLAVLLPGTALPEDILGLPAVKSGRTLWSLPDWAAAAAERPHLLLVDELDKARPETIGALLTLLSGLQVRGVALHPDTRIVCALQPVDRAEWLATESGRAMSARLVYLPTGYDRDRVAAEWGVDPAALAAAAGTAPAVELPTLPVVSDRQLSALPALVAGAPEPVRELIARGVAGERAPALLALLAAAERAAVTPAAVVAAAVKDPSVLDGLTVPELVALAGPALIEGTPAVVRGVLERIGRRGTAEDWAAAVRSMPEAVDAAAAGADEATVLRADPRADEEQAEALAAELAAMVESLASGK